MNIGKTLRKFENGIWSTDELAKDGWRLVYFCQLTNAHGLNALFSRGTARAGIMRQGDGYALVEVEL